MRRWVFSVRAASKWFGILLLAAGSAGAGEWRGSVEAIAEDDFGSGTSRTRTWIVSGGERIEVEFAGTAPELVCGERAAIKGTRSGGRIVATEAIRLAAEEPVAACMPGGEQRIAVLVYEFPGVSLASPVATIPELRDLFFSKTKSSVAGFWEEQSYRKVWVAGDVFGPFPMTKAYDVNRYWEALPDFLAAADGAVDLSRYNRFFIVWPVPEVSGWGGRGALGCYGNIVSPSKGKLSGSVTWLLVGTRQAHESMVGIASHEGGHNFSLHHADTLNFAPLALSASGAAGTRTEYQDVYSNMGSAAAFGSPAVMGGHWAAPHKAKLGWLEASVNTRDVDRAGTFRLQPYESSSAGVQALRVRRGTGNQWLWVEYRQPAGYDAALGSYSRSVFSGVLVHYEEPSLGYPDRSLLLDFHPESGGDFKDAALGAGETWRDPFSPLVLRVENAGAGGADVQVTYEAACMTLSPAGARHGTGAESGTFQVVAAAGCGWTASSLADWISLTGASAGNGNGTVAYRVAANTSRFARVGLVAAGRAVFIVTQDGTAVANRPPVALSISPSAGTGFNQTFTAVVSDPDGAADLDSVWVYFSGNAVCYVRIWPLKDRRVYLRSDDLATDLGPVTAGSPGRLKNSQCEVDAAGVSITEAGEDVTVVLPVTFAKGWTGWRGSGAGAMDAGGASVVKQLGSWLVGERPVAAPTITLQGVTNAASYQTGTVAPGEIITIFGAALGPATLKNLELTPDGRYLSTRLAGTAVLFDETPAPLLYTSAGQASAVVPYAVAGKAFTQVRVTTPDGTSDTLSVRVADAAVGMFTLDARGGGQGAALNQDYSVNSPSNAAGRGSVIMAYLTGEGLTDPRGEDGRIVGTELCRPKLLVTARVGGKDARVLYAGSAPGLITGVLQVNVEIPADVTPGDRVELLVAVGSSASQAGVTVAVK